MNIVKLYIYIMKLIDISPNNLKVFIFSYAFKSNFIVFKNIFIHIVSN